MTILIRYITACDIFFLFIFKIKLFTETSIQVTLLSVFKYIYFCWKIYAYIKWLKGELFILLEAYTIILLFCIYWATCGHFDTVKLVIYIELVSSYQLHCDLFYHLCCFLFLFSWVCFVIIFRGRVVFVYIYCRYTIKD